MKPSEVLLAIKVALSANKTIQIVGPSAAGKSATVHSAAAENGYTDLIDCRVSQYDAVDLRGLPTFKKMGNGDEPMATWAVPDFLPRGGKGILFLDEFTAAPPAVQVPCYQLLHDRQLGTYKVPDEWRIIAAGNRKCDGAVAYKQSSALRSRTIRIVFEPDLNDWCNWAFASQVAPEIIAFLRFRSELLHKYDAKLDKDEENFPAPRTWETLSECLKVGIPKEIEPEFIAGIIGKAAAAEFLGFTRIWRNLPSPDAILLNPQGGTIPTDPATKYALCTSLATKATENNMDNLCVYASRLEPEFNVLLMLSTIKAKPEVQNTQAFIKWASAHNNVICQ